MLVEVLVAFTMMTIMAAVMAQFSWKIVDAHNRVNRRILLLNEMKNILDTWLTDSRSCPPAIQKNNVNYEITTKIKMPRIIADDDTISQLTVDGFQWAEVRATWRSIYSNESESYSILTGGT